MPKRALDDERRSTIRDQWQKGVSSYEIAESIGVSRSAVQAYIARARRNGEDWPAFRHGVNAGPRPEGRKSGPKPGTKPQPKRQLSGRRNSTGHVVPGGADDLSDAECLMALELRDAGWPEAGIAKRIGCLTTTARTALSEIYRDLAKSEASQ